MPYPEHVKILQNIIEHTASEQNKTIDSVKWIHTEDNGVAIIINYEGRNIRIDFSDEELKKVREDEATQSVLNKIKNAIALMPGKNPPPEKQR